MQSRRNSSHAGSDGRRWVFGGLKRDFVPCHRLPTRLLSAGHMTARGFIWLVLVAGGAMGAGYWIGRHQGAASEQKAGTSQAGTEQSAPKAAAALPSGRSKPTAPDAE